MVRYLLSLFVIIIFSPILISLICVISSIFLFSGHKSIFFSQSRLGKDLKPFKLYKFKTMLDLYDNKGNLLDDEIRTTKIGRIIRYTSLDEIPEIYNVIKGEMNFVGPRPLLVDYKDLYSDLQKTRHDVLPGITGWAQINGRNSISWEEKFELDLWYIKNRSYLLDVKIIFLTFFKIFIFKDVYNKHLKPMEKFKGTKK